MSLRRNSLATGSTPSWPPRLELAVANSLSRFENGGGLALYWSMVGPFSGVIRKATLKRVKIDAEQAVKH